MRQILHHPPAAWKWNDSRGSEFLLDPFEIPIATSCYLAESSTPCLTNSFYFNEENVGSGTGSFVRAMAAWLWVCLTVTATALAWTAGFWDCSRDMPEAGW